MRVHMSETDIAHVLHQHHIQLLLDIVDPRGALRIGLGRAAPLAVACGVYQREATAARGTLLHFHA